MAEAALSFAVEKLGNLLIHKIDFLLGVEDKITSLKDDLQWMRSFLKDASEKQAKNEMICKWISDIRDLAHDAEDVIDSFALKVDAPRENRGMLGSCACFPQQVYHLDKLGQDIESIQQRLKAIGSRRETYGIKSLDDDLAGSSAHARQRIDDVERRRRVFPWEQDKHLVGLEKDVETLLRKAIFGEKKGLCVASIVGMGGVGKSMAKKVYNHVDVVGKFECRGWVSVSQDLSCKELMKAMVKQLVEHDEDKLRAVEMMKEASEEELMQMVHQKLEGKQYLVVVDDVWRQQDWEYLARAFPDNQAKASRVLITSRIHNIPKDARFVHKLDGLDFDKSWELFLQVALNENGEGKCPPELESIGRDILNKCEGLPLAIVVIGGLLLEQGPIVSRWEKVSRGLRSYFKGSKDNIGAILELSYDDLPPHLKACFLCLSFFREDDVIFAPTLIKVWIAEGLVSDEGEERMEEIGVSYLDELINRNMVQIEQLFDDQQVRYCRMHDLLHDLSITKAKEEINLVVVKEEKALRNLDSKARHIAIYCKDEKLTLLRSPRPHVRSLFFHESAHGALCRDDFWRNLDGLRVLYLDNLGLTVIPKMIGRLIGLRFLSLFNNQIRQLPKSIGHLKNLQTLILYRNEKVKVPNVLWKLKSLRHLYMDNDIICKVPLRLDTLKNLQTIRGFPVQSIVLEHLKELINLHILDVELVADVDVREFFNSLSMLRNLVVLCLKWNDYECISLDEIQGLKNITVLQINGPLEKLPNELPQKISTLVLARTRLNQDSMLILERLPKLLHLTMHKDAYKGEEMVINENGFPCLRVLSLIWLQELRKVHIRSGALSKLEQLLMHGCSNLEIIPNAEELRIMRNLKKLVIWMQSKATSYKLKSIEYVDALSNIPSVQISGDRWAGEPSDELNM